MNEIIEILYKGTELQIELIKEDEKYFFNTFMNKIKEIINDIPENSNIKLMTINTKEPYLLINEDNFNDILNKERNGNNLKIIANISEINQINSINSSFERTNSDFSSERKISIDNLNEEIDLKKNNDNNDIKDNKNNDYNNTNENKDNSNNKNNDNNNINSNNNINDKDNDNNNLNIEKNKKEDKNLINDLFKEEKILNSKDIYDKLKENEKKYKNLNKKKNPFKGEICDICEKEIEYEKYLCCICNRFSCCSNCEKKHNHTMFKYKDSFFSYIFSTFKFIEKTNNFKPPNSFYLFSNEIFIEPENDFNFSMRPNQKIKFPIKIINESSNIIKSDTFIILVRNFNYLNIKYSDNQIFSINPKSSIIFFFDIESFDKLKSENIEFLLYSDIINIKQNDKIKFNLKIDINEEPEEDALNKFFSPYKNILLLSKEHKKKILECVQLLNKNLSPLEIYDLLKENQWNVDQCRKYL